MTKVLLATMLLLLAGCANYPSDTVSGVVTGDLPGAGKIGLCKAYADALFTRLKSMRVECREIYFRYIGFGCSGGHAMVIYRDQGAWWIADNTFPYPIRSGAATPQDWIDEECATNEATDKTFHAWPIMVRQ